MSIGPVPAVGPTGGAPQREVPLAAPIARPGAVDHAAAQVGLSRSELLGHLTAEDAAVVAAAGGGDTAAVQAALATERYLGRLFSEIGVDQAQSLYDRYARAPYPIEPAHLAGIITYLEGRRHARTTAPPQVAPVPRVDRVV